MRRPPVPGDHELPPSQAVRCYTGCAEGRGRSLCLLVEHRFLVICVRLRPSARCTLTGGQETVLSRDTKLWEEGREPWCAPDAVYASHLKTFVLTASPVMLRTCERSALQNPLRSEGHATFEIETGFSSGSKPTVSEYVNWSGHTTKPILRKRSIGCTSATPAFGQLQKSNGSSGRK